MSERRGRGDTRFAAVATDDVGHLRGADARSSNVGAARAVADTVRSTLGPAGLDTMLVSERGSVTVTNDGETILKSMDVDHPAARVVVEVAKAQATAAGDGTTTAVLFAGELLRGADRLLDHGTPPAAVVTGYQWAADRLLDELDDLADLADPVDPADLDDPDDDLLRRVAETSLTGKAVEGHAGVLAGLVLDATAAVRVGRVVDLDYLELVARPGASAAASELRRGAVLDAGPVADSMPTDLAGARVLVLQETFDLPEPETEARVAVGTADGRGRLRRRETRRARDAADRVTDLGVDVVLCHERVDDRIAARLAARGVLAVEHLEREGVDLGFLQEVTGATAVSGSRHATRDSLGRVDVSREGSNGPLYVENPDGHGVTLVVRGSTDHVAAEVERAVSDAVDVVARTVRDGRVVAGAGATETELAARLRAAAPGVDGRPQLAVEAFADALEAVPTTLARNAGLDPVDALVALRAAHADGRTAAGVDIATGGVADATAAGVVQPAYVLEQAAYNAAKVASALLKVDEVISVGRREFETGAG
ncbi:thermosome subunit alpha [Candidatus Halobonum tyrrellensis]|uniref:Thermosome n=1 Tax=Candidatus Halobonum tyrrellensis G22 TaxID=1324957 RepID=V4GNT8_9EURY|nr:thermosome subunit alpha [Candidatus Halobonum tyrrellensis]ESP87056.1 thermosome [Candidatus Halobonum tyrrellensis G22]